MTDKKTIDVKNMLDADLESLKKKIADEEKTRKTRKELFQKKVASGEMKNEEIMKYLMDSVGPKVFVETLLETLKDDKKDKDDNEHYRFIYKLKTPEMNWK